MKKFASRATPRSAIGFFLLAILSTVLIYSCRKDHSSNATLSATDLKIAEAKSWYQHVYPTTVSNKSSAIRNNALNTTELNQLISPDWQHGNAYTRFNREVIELPADPSVNFGSALMDKEKNKLLSNKAYSKSSFILLKSDKGYDAYVMTLIADSDYINKHPEKLDHNTYSKRDADFSGLVLYFTPKGKYVSGWRYKNGNILQPSSSNTAQPGVTKTQSITHATAPTCLDWYLVTYEDDVRVSEIYLYTTCTSGADEGGGGGGATAPPQCPTTGNNTDAVAVKAPGKATNATPPPTPQPTTPGDGGGFPPPSSDPCTIQTPTFGINNSNAVIPSANFQAFLNYAKGLGYQVTNPTSGFAYGNDGSKYAGTFTYVLDNSGNAVASYFTPNASNGPFQTGYNYNLGNTLNNSSPSNTNATVIFGPGNFSSGQVTYTPPANGGITGGGSGGSIPYSPPSNTAIVNQIQNKPFVFYDIPCDIIQKWVSTAKFTPDNTIINKLNSVVVKATASLGTGAPGFTASDVAYVQKINDASSTVVNMDYFPVTISQLPVINGQRVTADQFLQYIRLNINNFINDSKTFIPYNFNGIDDRVKWSSNDPKGALVAIDLAGPDNATVITSYSSNNMWTFTTIYDPVYGGAHPVSGNRNFGYITNNDGSYTFYTRGVDRLTSWDIVAFEKIPEYLGFQTGVPFTMADNLWKSFQSGLTNFVKANSGNGKIDNPQIFRPNWDAVKEVLAGKKPLSTLSKDCQ